MLAAALPGAGRKLLTRTVSRYNPVEFMAHNTGDVWRALGRGVAMAALTALACLAFAAASDARTLSLDELARTESIVMSCDDAGLATAEPLWCADPSSPQCIPAAPDVPSVQLGDRSDLWLPPAVLPPTLRAYVLSTWPEPNVALAPGRLDQARVERPPRA